MGSATRPPRRLPQRVYWLRRGMVLAIGLLLVFGVGKLVGGLGSDPAERAATAAVTTTQATAGTTPSAQATTSAAPVGPVAPPKKAVRQSVTPLATPSGSCAVDDVTVLPTIPQAPAGGDIPIILQLVGTEPACNFTVSAKTVVVKITKGEADFWSSQQCPAAIPNTQVVVRSGVPAPVPVIWNGRGSDESCDRTGYAMPGEKYHVYAAALGSAPSDVEFEVTQAVPAVKTKTVHPKPKNQPNGAESPSASSSE